MNKMKMMMLAGGLLAAASCSDFDDFNTVPVAADPAADQTLWENISKNPELSDFKAVLERVGYDKVLDAAHTYTVWAPVNGSFDADSLANVSDAKVVREFLNNLIADYAHRENDPNDTVIYMLNEKLLKFTGKNSTSLAFDAQRILPSVKNPSIYNYPSTNGLLYVVSSPSVFRYNGYEYISEMAGRADSMIAYFKHFERITLDEENSVKGDIRDGVQHYDDSVMIVSNTLTTEVLVAQLENEDSLYTVLIPTNEAWEEAYSRISSYFKYIPTLDYQDLDHSDVGTDKGGNKSSIMAATKGKTTVTLAAPPADAAIQDVAAYWTDSITKLYMTNFLVYSETEKHYNKKLASGGAFTEADTLRSTTYNRLTNLPELDAATEEIVKLSNGHARIINRIPFLSEETYAPVIRTREVSREVTAIGSSYTRFSYPGTPPPSFCVLERENETLGWVETTLPTSSNFAPELDFELTGIRSTTYDVFLVTVPNLAVKIEERKPYTLLVDINYTDENNKQIAGRFDGETVQVGNSNIKKVVPFEFGSPDKVDTLKLGRITFPVCYYGTDAKPNIKVMHSVSTFLSSSKKKYEQMLRIANIILRPVVVTEE